MGRRVRRTALAGAETSAPCCCETPAWAPVHTRQTPFCTETAFNSYHSETEMMRYIRRLESRDLALNEAMIPLGSCTMKLNAASEMIPITWPETSSLHPFVPADQSEGIREMLSVLSDRLAKITGFAAVSLQPNAGAAGEYAGLLNRCFHVSLILILLLLCLLFDHTGQSATLFCQWRNTRRYVRAVLRNIV